MLSRMDSPTAGGPLRATGHAVQFYGNETSLVTTVAGFLCDGLVRGEPAVVIATTAHRSAIEAQLAARLINVEAARLSGDLVMLDAHETLATFLSGDTPDPEAFRRNIGGVIERALRGRRDTIVRAYGEMVDVLWQEGRTDAAIRVELLWNLLATSYGFALLCGYSMGSFYKQAERLDEICRLHTDVVQPEDSNLAVFTPRRNAG
jgi:hypothetical protein